MLASWLGGKYYGHTVPQRELVAGYIYVSNRGVSRSRYLPALNRHPRFTLIFHDGERHLIDTNCYSIVHRSGIYNP
jgi:hypothetical protein